MEICDSPADNCEFAEGKDAAGESMERSGARNPSVKKWKEGIPMLALVPCEGRNAPATRAARAIFHLCIMHPRYCGPSEKVNRVGVV